MTLSDLERPNDRNYSLFHTIRSISESILSNSLKLNPYCQPQKCNPWSLVYRRLRALSLPQNNLHLHLLYSVVHSLTCALSLVFVIVFFVVQSSQLVAIVLINDLLMSACASDDQISKQLVSIFSKIGVLHDRLLFVVAK